MEGTFPPFEEVIPKDSDKVLELHREGFLAALRKAALFTGKDSLAVRFSFSFNKLTLSARTPEVGESVIEMSVEYPYDPMEIGFNPKLLIDALRVLDDPMVRFELKDPTSAGLIREGERFSYVLMPINLFSA